MPDVERLEPAGRQWWKSVAEPREPADLKTDQPHSARMYDYFLGGKDNFPADREAAEQTLAVFPNARIGARENRAFMARAIRFLAGEVGIRQFLDVGTGIPTSPNLHEVAQAIAPEARVVYTDNDPIVLAHARALLTGTTQGRTAYLDADARAPERILAAPELRETLDLTRPVALSLIALLHFIPDDQDPAGILRHLIDALPSGSYLVLSHATAELDPIFEQAARTYRERGIPFQFRTRAEVEGLFAGLELVDPGIVVAPRWRPDPASPAAASPDAATAEVTDAQVSGYVGVARKS